MAAGTNFHFLITHPLLSTENARKLFHQKCIPTTALKAYKSDTSAKFACVHNSQPSPANQPTYKNSTKAFMRDALAGTSHVCFSTHCMFSAVTHD